MKSGASLLEIRLHSLKFSRVVWWMEETHWDHNGFGVTDPPMPTSPLPTTLRHLYTSQFSLNAVWGTVKEYIVNDEYIVPSGFRVIDSSQKFLDRVSIFVISDWLTPQLCFVKGQSAQTLCRLMCAKSTVVSLCRNNQQLYGIYMLHMHLFKIKIHHRYGVGYNGKQFQVSKLKILSVAMSIMLNYIEWQRFRKHQNKQINLDE